MAQTVLTVLTQRVDTNRTVRSHDAEFDRLTTTSLME